jgi:hypothetical protein
MHRQVMRSGKAPSQAMIDIWQSAGVDGFEWLVLEVTEPENSVLQAAEQRWIEHYAGRLFNKRPAAGRRNHLLGRNPQVSITLPESAVRALDKIAALRGISRSDVITHLVLAGLDREALVQKITEAVA